MAARGRTAPATAAGTRPGAGSLRDRRDRLRHVTEVAVGCRGPFARGSPRREGAAVAGRAGTALSAGRHRRALAHSSASASLVTGETTPSSVTIAVTSSGGVTSNAGLYAWVPSGATAIPPPAPTDA